jgi:hypothetical protein
MISSARCIIVAVITTILAVYGAIVATGTLLYSIRVFNYSGPKVQAEAYLHYPPKDDPNNWHIFLRVWNKGRQAIKVTDNGLTILERSLSHEKWIPPPGKTGSLQLEWDGPEFPIMLEGHSGERWFGRAPATGEPESLALFTDYLGMPEPDPHRQFELWVILEIGGKQMLIVPVGDARYPAPIRSVRVGRS